MTKQLNLVELETKSSAEFVEEIKKVIEPDFEPIVHVIDHSDVYVEVIVRTRILVHSFVFYRASERIESHYIALLDLKAVGLIPGA
ncbi:hypothetical protein M670_00177 [Schinkia azotoformans MEV2011]|uniref:Uncharacterized protein n=1 Tax=Schinkia azotoformans MEV2011 TaxID=1348973 RepID=A0A072NRU4_SCHAZ|nr:hypothetical protein [Schinkia azotoformans]KEF40161.1 hypothetical protein M670_00177 [Schinkia azotoformans MEV2011]